MKISRFRAKAHLVYHWCLYNKAYYSLWLSVADVWHASAAMGSLGMGSLRGSTVEILLGVNRE